VIYRLGKCSHGAWIALLCAQLRPWPMNSIDFTKDGILCAAQTVNRFFSFGNAHFKYWLFLFLFFNLFSIHSSSAQDPTLTGIEGVALTYNEGQAATAITGSITADDIDSPLLANATVQISGNYSSTEDLLQFTNAFSITGSYDGATGTLTLTGPATPADFTSALRTITYQNTNNDNPSTLVRTISFSLNDGLANSLTVTRDIQVNGINDAPVGQNDSFVMNEDTDLDCGCLLINDHDPDGDNIVALHDQAPAHGTVTDQGGFFIYTPDPDFYGTDSFTYFANDGTVNSAPITVHVTVLPINDAPIALNDAKSTDEDNAVDIPVLSNDTDVDDVLNGSMIVIVATPSHGAVSVNTATGVVSYTPSTNYNGNDSFTYQVKDAGNALSNVATVSIVVSPVNDNPISNMDLATTPEDIAILIPVLANDTDVENGLDVSTLVILTGPTNGSAVVEPATGKILYTPSTNFSGSDSFTYAVKDSEGAATAPATVTITVTPVNDLPTANPDLATTQEEIAVSIPVLANDTDIDGTLDLSSLVIVTGPANGSAVVDPSTGEVLYTPSKDFTGNDSFVYTVEDNQGGISAPATVTITVTPVNDPPVAVDDAAITDKNLTVHVHILENDYDVDNDVIPTSVVIVSNPTHGTIVFNPSTGVASYTPESGFLGSDLFTYTIQDPGGLISSPATVTITVSEPVNKTPHAIDDAIVNSSLISFAIDVLANDYDEDNTNDELTIISVTNPSMGTVSIVDGKIVYQPAGLMSTTVSFTYTIQDPTGLTDEAVVTIENSFLPLAVSEGFSPNNDGNNETWYIQGIENYPNNFIKVFDRWGFLVYQKQHYENIAAPWDGRGNSAQHSGKLLDQGTYYYILEPGGELKTMTGYVVIVK
jgi:gliding motility-associated-like protein